MLFESLNAGPRWTPSALSDLHTHHSRGDRRMSLVRISLIGCGWFCLGGAVEAIPSFLIRQHLQAIARSDAESHDRPGISARVCHTDRPRLHISRCRLPLKIPARQPVNPAANQTRTSPLPRWSSTAGRSPTTTTRSPPSSQLSRPRVSGMAGRASYTGSGQSRQQVRPIGTRNLRDSLRRRCSRWWSVETPPTATIGLRGTSAPTRC